MYTFCKSLISLNFFQSEVEKRGLTGRAGEGVPGGIGATRETALERVGRVTMGGIPPIPPLERGAPSNAF